MQYWNNKENLKRQAMKHTEEMSVRFAKEISDSIMKTKIRSSAINHSPGKTEDIEIILSDSVDASIRAFKTGGKVTLLNFASYKNPGGRFLDGSSAQEESICHRSILYNILSSEKLKEYYEWNNLHKNKGLYKNRALYTPDIIFDNAYKIDVITCAAPNFNAASRYMNVIKEDNSKVLKDRIEFLLNVVSEFNTDTLILGAWGCGVFGQNPAEVARLFKEALNTHKFKKVIFAIIDNETFEIFKDENK